MFGPQQWEENTLPVGRTPLTRLSHTQSCPAQRSAEIIWQHTFASEREHRERRQLTYRFYIIPLVKQDLPATTQRDCGSPSLLLKLNLCSYYDLVKISPVQSSLCPNMPESDKGSLVVGWAEKYSCNLTAWLSCLCLCRNNSWEAHSGWFDCGFRLKLEPC